MCFDFVNIRFFIFVFAVLVEYMYYIMGLPCFAL